MYLSVLAACCLLVCSQVPVVWSEHPGIVSRNSLSHADTVTSVVGSTFADSAPPTINPDGTMTYRLTVVLMKALASAPNVLQGSTKNNLGIIGLAFVNNSSQVDCIVGYNDSSPSQFNHLLTLGTITKVSTVRSNYLAFDSTVTFLNIAYVSSSNTLPHVDLSMVSVGSGHRVENIEASLASG